MKPCSKKHKNHTPSISHEFDHHLYNPIRVVTLLMHHGNVFVLCKGIGLGWVA